MRLSYFRVIPLLNDSSKVVYKVKPYVRMRLLLDKEDHHPHILCMRCALFDRRTNSSDIPLHPSTEMHIPHPTQKFTTLPIATVLDFILVETTKRETMPTALF